MNTILPTVVTAKVMPVEHRRVVGYKVVDLSSEPVLPLECR